MTNGSYSHRPCKRELLSSSTNRANGSSRSFFYDQETVNTDYIYDSLWCYGGHVSELLCCSNWTGLMEQDVSCFPSDALTVPQTSLQPGLNRLYEPQFTITQGRNRRSQRNTSGVSLLCFLFIIWPSLFAVLLSDKLNKTHSGNSKKCSFGDLRGVRRPPAGGGGGGSVFAILPIQGSGKKNICWRDSFCLWFAWGGQRRRWGGWFWGTGYWG